MKRITLRLLGLGCACSLLITSAGCTFLEKCGSITSALGGETVGRVDIVFPGHIHILDDTVNPGRQVPGLSGRVWLFAEDGKKTVAARGNIEAELWDMTPTESGKGAEKKVEWKFHVKDLRHLQREDQIGMGYTLFLPWDEYRPEIKKVQLRLAYIDEHGVRHESDPALLTLRGTPQPAHVQMDERRNILATSLPGKK